ncbi:MAG: glycosyltransferase family 2 protein [Caulobacteraceae bacterium]
MGGVDHAFIVMAHGDSPYLEGCIASLAAQTVGSTILVTTSTPSDFIDAAARVVGAPVTLNPRPDGIAADWNFALGASPARYVTLAHQDDLYFPPFLARSLALLQSSARAALAFTGYLEVDDDGRASRSKISLAKHLLERLTLGDTVEPGRGRLRAFLSLGNPLPCSSVTFDRQRLVDFAFSGAFRSNLDWDAWLRLNEAGVQFARTPERLVGRRHNPLTATASLTREGVRRREDLIMFRRLWPRPLAGLIALAYRTGYG